MKRIAFIIFSFILFIVVSCNNDLVYPGINENANNNPKISTENRVAINYEDSFKISPSSKVPEELTKGFWTDSLSAYGRVFARNKINFFNVGNQGRYRQDYQVKSLTDSFHSVSEGTVKFLGFGFTLFVVKHEIISGEDSGNPPIKRKVYDWWKVGKEDEKVILYLKRSLFNDQGRYIPPSILKYYNSSN